MQRIKLLGKVNIEDENGRSSRLVNSARGVACLAYLIYAGEGQKREFMADLLWEASSTQQSLGRLRELLYRVRKAIPAVQTSRHTITFQADSGDFVDVLRLQATLALTGGSQADAAQLAAALQLYKGAFLDGFYLEDAPRFNEWLVVARERLHRQVVAAYDRLCQLYAAEEAWGEGVAAAQRWLALEPLDEAAYRWQMRCLAETGQTAAALQAYETCRQTLWQELDVEPERATRALVQQLLAQQQAETAVSAPQTSLNQTLAADQLPAPSALPPNAYLPYLRNHDFVGRETTLRYVATLFAEAGVAGHRPVVAITGTGGMGKTQTAVEFSYRYGRFFSGGVYWLNFDEAENVVEEVARIGSERSMGLYQEMDKLTLADRAARVQRAWQDPIPRLLIFDNCESEALLQAWLPVSGGCYVLLTSRRGEWARELGVTAVPLHALSLLESVALLRQIAPHATSDEAEQIANEVGRLPLALHLAGSFLSRYQRISPTAYLAQLQDENLLQHPSLQGYGLTHSPTGHALSLARSFAVSFDQLDDQDATDQMARQLLAHAICFAPGEPLAQDLLLATVLLPNSGGVLDIASVLQAEDGLARLVALGFLRREGVEQLVIHRLVRTFAQTVLGDLATAVAMVEAELVRQVTAVWKKSLNMSQLPIPTSQLRYVADKALARRDLTAAALANHLGRHFVEVQALDLAQPYLAQALAIRQTLLGNQGETAVSLINMGFYFFIRVQFATAQKYYEQAAAIYEKESAPDDSRAALNLNNLAIVHSRQGHYEKALAYYEKALAIYRQALPEDDPTVAMLLTNAGINYRRMGQYRKAREAYKQAVAWREANLGKESLATMVTLHSLGYLEMQTGHYDLAQAHFQRVLAVRKQVLGQENAATALTQLNLARIMAVNQQPSTAKAMLEAVLVVLTKQYGEDHSRVGEALAYLGDVCRLLGDYTQAANHLLRAQQIHEATGERNTEMVEALLALADYYLETENSAQAKAVLDKNLAICLEIFRPEHPLLGRIYLRWGEWHQQRDELEQAAAFFTQAHGILSPGDGETAVSPTHVDFVRLQKQ